MIENDIPVIISMGPSLFNQKVNLYSQIQLSDSNKENYSDITVSGHYVTITGVIFDHYTDDIWLKVSSWGSCYYIDFNEYLTYAGCNIANNILHIDIL